MDNFIHDELMDEPRKFDVFFQFGEDKPIQMTTIENGHKFSLTLDSSQIDDPAVEFADGKGNSFKIFMKKCF